MDQSNHLKLAIRFIIAQRFGDREETYLPTPRRRLLDLLYLADYQWWQGAGVAYLGNWTYANNGPYLQAYADCLEDLDGIEIVTKNRGYVVGHYSRLYGNLDPHFENILTSNNRAYYFTSSEKLRDIVYATPPMKTASLGGPLLAKLEIPITLNREEHHESGTTDPH